MPDCELSPRGDAVAPARAPGAADDRVMFAVLISVGPTSREVARLHDTLEMLSMYEAPDSHHLVLVDDAPSSRGHLGVSWPSRTVIRTDVRRSRRVDAQSAMTAATLEGLSVCRELGSEFVVKLDVDVAIVAPFSASIRAAFADPRLGIVGAYDVGSAGGSRDWSVWKKLLFQADRRVMLRSTDRTWTIWRKTARDAADVRRLRAAAVRQAPLGAHCLGGAYAVSQRFLRAAELDWRPWVGTGLSEDVVVGLLCSAAGLQMRGMVAPGEPFAVSWRGLPGPPAILAANGHSIIHSVKARSIEAERELRAALLRA